MVTAAVVTAGLLKLSELFVDSSILCQNVLGGLDELRYASNLNRSRASRLPSAKRAPLSLSMEMLALAARAPSSASRLGARLLLTGGVRRCVLPQAAGRPCSGACCRICMVVGP